MRGGLRSNHRGILGDCLWLAARLAQHRCESEWRHLLCQGEWCLRSDHMQECALDASPLERAISSISNPWHWRLHFNLRLVRVYWRNLKDGIASEALDDDALPTCCLRRPTLALSARRLNWLCSTMPSLTLRRPRRGAMHQSPFLRTQSRPPSRA
jgi:hypothetical protein